MSPARAGDVPWQPVTGLPEVPHRCRGTLLDLQFPGKDLDYQHAAIRGPDEQANPAPSRPRPRTDLFSAWVQNETDWVRFGRGEDLSTYYRERNANGNSIPAAASVVRAWRSSCAADMARCLPSRSQPPQ